MAAGAFFVLIVFIKVHFFYSKFFSLYYSIGKGTKDSLSQQQKKHFFVLSNTYMNTKSWRVQSDFSFVSEENKK